MAYAIHDFTESLAAARRDSNGPQNDQLVKVIAAWGNANDIGTEWSGGFVIELKDGRLAVITGWCDYTGWGCQDGGECVYYSGDENALIPVGKDFDTEPVDLNRWIESGFRDWEDD